MSAYGGYAYGYDYGGSCCEPKVDAITLLTVIGAIAGLSLFLRQAVIDNMIQAGRKKKKRSLEFVFTGNIRFNVIGEANKCTLADGVLVLEVICPDFCPKV